MTTNMYDISYQRKDYTRSSPKLIKSNQLDIEFDQILANMKKYIIELKDKKTKQMCALWIKKLCEISDTQNVDYKQLRNVYCFKLLNCLENNQPLEYPFSEKPPLGNLKSFDESTTSTNQISKTDMEYSSLKNDTEHISSENDFHNPSSYNINQNFQFKTIEDKPKNYLIQNMDSHLRILETKFKDERLNLQQNHNLEIQRLLDRKNTEIEDIKSNFNKKKKEYEDTVFNLEKKAELMTNDLLLCKNDYEKKIIQLKNQIEDIAEKKQLDNDRKLKAVIENYEKEKFDLQKQHTKAFQDLVDETNLRLKKVECEYNEQQSVTDKVIAELENRTQMLKCEMEKNAQTITELQSEIKDKCKVIENTEAKLQDAYNKCKNLENDNLNLKESHNKEIEQINHKIDLMIRTRNEENENYLTRLNQISDESAKHKASYEKKHDKFNAIIREKDNLICNLNKTIVQQKLQAELALNELKKEIEINSNKLYDEMKDQMIKVEGDLEKSKNVREKQLKETAKQIEDLKNSHAKQIEDLTKEFEIEKYKMRNECESEKQKIIKLHEKDIDDIQNQFQLKFIELNQMSSAKIENLTATNNELEMRMIQLDQELNECSALRKQQITELGILREDEKIKLTRKYEHDIENLKSIYENEKNQLKADLKEQKEELNEKIRNLTRRADEDNRNNNDEIKSVRERVKFLENEIKRNERERNQMSSNWEEEKNTMKKHYQITVTKLEQQLEVEKNRNRELEKINHLANIENEHSLINLKMQYEEKIKGLLPNEIRKDLEDTISALKLQIESLQQRTTLLQAELDDRNQLINSSTYTASFS